MTRICADKIRENPRDPRHPCSKAFAFKLAVETRLQLTNNVRAIKEIGE